ncbi:GNAT family protein [Stenotrophomonas maltophilia]
MMIPDPTFALPPLRPVLRGHLVQLQTAHATLRPFLRSDLPRWRRFDDHRQGGRRDPAGVDEEARFLGLMHRSRLQQENDQLLLGVFDAERGTLLDQLHVRLHSLHARSAELRSVQHWHAHTEAALLALCPFLFNDVGLHRLFVLLPTECDTPFARALRASGFEQEGVLRDQHLDLHGWHDRQLLALTAPAWRHSRQRAR